MLISNIWCTYSEVGENIYPFTRVIKHLIKWYVVSAVQSVIDCNDD